MTSINLIRTHKNFNTVNAKFNELMEGEIASLRLEGEWERQSDYGIKDIAFSESEKNIYLVTKVVTLTKVTRTAKLKRVIVCSAVYDLEEGFIMNFKKSFVGLEIEYV